mgnify:FL=1
MFFNTTKPIPQQRLDKCMLDLSRNEVTRSLTPIFATGETTITDDPSVTGYTDGKNVVLGEQYIMTLNDAAFRGLVLHENWHKFMMDLKIWRHLWLKNPQLTNVACDFHINGMMLDMNEGNLTSSGKPFIELPDGGLYDEQFRIKHGEWMDAGAIYRKIEQDIKNKPQAGQSGTPQSGNESQSGDPSQSPAGGTSEAKEDKVYDAIPDEFDQHGWDKASKLSETEQRELEQEIDSAMRQGALLAGASGSGGDNEFLKEYMKPKIDWHEPLREFALSTCGGTDETTFRIPNRRVITEDIIMPSTYSETVEELVLAMDRSYSIQQPETTVFLSEMKSICEVIKPKRVRILYWDTQVVRDEVYEEHEVANIMNSTKPSGGGGTDVLCVTSYLSEHNIKPQAVIVFTDGDLYRGWGQWTSPVLWCVVDNRNARPDTGKVLHVTTSEILKRGG